MDILNRENGISDSALALRHIKVVRCLVELGFFVCNGMDLRFVLV